MKKKLISFILVVVTLIITGCTKDEFVSKKHEINEDNFTVFLDVSKPDGKILINSTFLNTTKSDISLFYGRNVIDITLDNKPLVDAYRLDAIEKIISGGKEIQFNSIEIDEEKWNKAKKVKATMEFEKNGQTFKKSVWLK